MMAKRFFIFLQVLLLMFVVAGCNNDAKKEEVNNTVQEIKKRGKMIVGTEAAFAPFEFVEDGKIVGYGPDILKEIAKELNVGAEQIDIPFSGIFTALDTRKIDFIATTISETPERREKYALTTPIADYTVMWVQSKDKPLIDVTDLNGRIIGCNAQSIIEEQLLEINEKLKAEGKQGFEIRRYPSNNETFLDVKNGRIDLILVPKTMLSFAEKNEPNTYLGVTSFGRQQYLFWAIRKEDKELLDFVNNKIIELKKSGKLAQLQEKWFGESWDLPDAV